MSVDRYLKYLWTILCSCILAGALATVITGCATRTLEECDPNDASFTDLIMCRDQYTDRSDILQGQAEQEADSAAQSEMTLNAVDQAREAAEKKLDQLRGKIIENQSRIDQLKYSNSASESELADMQALLNEIRTEEVEVRKRQQELQNKQDSNELDNKLRSLAAKEAELEALLLALETA